MVTFTLVLMAIWSNRIDRHSTTSRISFDWLHLLKTRESFA